MVSREGMVLGIITLSLIHGRNRSTNTRFFSLPITSSLGKVPPPKRPGPEPVPSGPLVGDLEAEAWSPLIRGSVVVLTCESDSRFTRAALKQPVVRRRWSPGSTRYSVACAVVVPSVRPPYRRGRGGDEETRTPDPLLAKEMLFRLSYVPIVPDPRLVAPGRVVGVSGLEPETSALSGQCSNQLS